jgi:hypothetical protein
MTRSRSMQALRPGVCCRQRCHFFVCVPNSVAHRYQKLLGAITRTQFQPNAQTPIVDKDSKERHYWVDALSVDQVRERATPHL